MTKAILEKNQIKSFLQIANIDYRSLESCKTDPPDLVLVSSENKKIGIEHSMLTVKNGSKIKANFKAFDEVIFNSKELYEKSENPIIYVWVDYKKSVDTRKNKSQSLSNELFELVKKNVPNLGRKTYVETEIPNNELPYYTDRIKISRHINFKLNVWQRPGFVMSSAIPNEILTDKINNKNLRLISKSYHQQYNETWLVLIVEGTEWSEFATYKPIDFIIDEKWIFDRIYVCGLFNNELERLK